MSVEHVSVSAHDLSRRATAVLDRVEHGERLTITRYGEPIAEIIPIGRTRGVLARWIKGGLISPPPTHGLRDGRGRSEGSSQVACGRAGSYGERNPTRYAKRPTIVTYLDTTAILKLLRRKAETDAALIGPPLRPCAAGHLHVRVDLV
jgi:prevent-host-death family protein